MGFTDSVDAMLSGRERSRVKRNGIVLLLLLLTLDGACVVLIRESLAFVGLPQPEWTLPALLAALPSFNGDTVDVQLLFILRVLTISILAWVAVRVGQADLSSVKSEGDDECTVVPITEPLLINGGPAASGPSCTCSGSAGGSGAGGSGGPGGWGPGCGATLEPEILSLPMIIVAIGADSHSDWPAWYVQALQLRFEAHSAQQSAADSTPAMVVKSRCVMPRSVQKLLAFEHCMPRAGGGAAGAAGCSRAAASRSTISRWRPAAAI